MTDKDKKIDEYKLIYLFSEKLIQELRDLKANETKYNQFKNIIFLNQELFYRVVLPSEKNKEINENRFSEIDKKIDTVRDTINSYMDYKEGKKTKETFLQDLTMNDIKSEMSVAAAKDENKKADNSKENSKESEIKQKDNKERNR